MSAVAKSKDAESSASQMSSKRLIKICRQKGLYETPEYNDALYLNYEGFSSIDNLGAYVNIKSLFLEGNVLTKIENLDHLSNLRGLYLQNNMLQSISGLDNLNELVCLDLARNQIRKIENMSHLHKLETLNLENNLISSAEDLEQIICNKALTTLNLSGNKFQTEEEGFKLIRLLSKLPNLKSLYLKGNECVNKMDWYRKHTISSIRSLTYLDDRPVFDNERRLNDAWLRGGRVAEDEEKKKIQQERVEKRNLSRQIRREKYEARRKAMMARIEREQKEEDETNQLNASGSGEDVSEEAKVSCSAADMLSSSDREDVSEETKVNEQVRDEQEDEMQDSIFLAQHSLPGMINTNFTLQLD